MVLVVLRILSSGFLCCACCLNESQFTALLCFLICGLVQVLFSSLVVNFAIAILLLLPLD